VSRCASADAEIGLFHVGQIADDRVLGAGSRGGFLREQLFPSSLFSDGFWADTRSVPPFKARD
jgi:hypothetical protein